MSLCFSTKSYTQNKTIITGLVIDSISNEPIPYAVIFLIGTERGGLTDENGKFNVSTTSKFDTIQVSAIGYDKKEYVIANGITHNLRVSLSPIGVALNEIIVNPKKEKYSKKNNPAVEFVKRIISSKEFNDPRVQPHYNYDKYEKITLALNNFTPEQQGWMNKNFSFLKEYIDTSEITNKPILNISVKEKASNIHYRLAPKSEKEVIKGIRRVGLDDIADQEAVQTFLEDIFRDIDIYDNDINILQNRFVSPLSRIAIDFYKYYLTDTININGDNCAELTFVPHSPQSFGFTGRMYVSLSDTTMFIRKLTMTAPKSINLNFVDNLIISQEYEKSTNGSRLKTKDDMTIEFTVIPGIQGLYAKRNTRYSNHNFAQLNDSKIFEYTQSQIIKADAESQSDIFWENHRLTNISQNEKNISSMIAQLRANPLYYWSEQILKILVGGYITTGKNSKIDIGPVNTFLSFNDIEGARIKTGFMSTANLSKHWFGRCYVAYGFKDHIPKYSAEIEYSFNKKKYHPREFPVHSIRASHLYDVDMLGQQYSFTNPDNIFLSLKRQDNTQMTYHRVSNLEYTLELYNNFSITAGIKHERQEATRYIPFINNRGESYSHYNESSLNIRLRYAPGEKFFQAKTVRIPVNLDAPILILSHTYAPKGTFGNMFEINKTEISIQKRFWFSAFGYTDIILKGGKVWSQSPYPNLLIPNANLSYTIQPESYSLMNAMEFINDQYLSWDITYWINGTIFNRIPLLNKLQLREVISFRGLWGDLSNRNTPSSYNDLFQFPINANTRPMTSTPYMEIGAGVDNIFKILRIDYVWRLTYRDTPNTDKSGVRIALHMTF